MADPKIGMVNRELVRAYYEMHIGCTMTECGKAMGLDRKTVSRHVRMIRQEWEQQSAMQEERRDAA